MYVFRSLFSSLLLLIFAACTSAVLVKSTPPKASVSVRSTKTGSDEMIGETPIQLDSGKIEEIIQSGPVIIKISKRGYQFREYVIPNLFATNLVIDAYLYPIISNYKETNKIVALLFKCQRYIMDRKYEEALEITNELLKINENIASAYEMKGAIYFRLKKYQKSYDNWIKVVELEPDNAEAQKMVELIDKTQSQPQ